MLSHNYYKKSAASYNNKNNNKHYIQTIEDPFIIRDQISIPITSRHKEPNPERYGNTVCDDYIENIPKSKVSYAKIFPSFSTREPVNNFRIQNEQELINENNNIYIKEFPVYLCINSFSENNDIFKNKYKMTFKIDFQNESLTSFSCLISIRCIDIDILFNYQYHLTPYSYRSFINKHIIPNDIKQLASKNLFMSFKRYVLFLKHMIDNCSKSSSEYKARIIIPEHGDNDIIKFLISNHQEEYIFYDILSIFMFRSSFDKIYIDINDDYVKIKNLHKIIKSQLVRFANSISIHAPSIYIKELQHNNLSVNRDYKMKSKSYWMSILENCFNDNIDINNNIKNHDNHIKLKLFDDNSNLRPYIIKQKKDENVNLSFKNSFSNKKNNKNYHLEHIFSSECKFQCKIPVIIIINDDVSSHLTKKFTIQLKQKDENYYIFISDDNDLLFHCVTEELNEDIMDNMMNKLHIRLINSKEYEENSENYDTNLNKNLIKFPVGALIEKLIEKSNKSKNLELVDYENLINKIDLLNSNKSLINSNNNIKTVESFNNLNYGQLFIYKTNSFKHQITFFTKINILPKEILAKNIRNKYLLLSEEIKTSKLKIYILIDAIRSLNNNIFKYVDIPNWSLDYAKGNQTKRIL
ncbi:hypothetical protein U3516DRAFT_650889 [Neocallimastix sp. 'constans']